MFCASSGLRGANAYFEILVQRLGVRAILSPRDRKFAGDDEILFGKVNSNIKIHLEDIWIISSG